MIVLALAIAALILALIGELRAHGEDLIGWAVVCLAVIHIAGRL